jgi:hypothetical protein
MKSRSAMALLSVRRMSIPDELETSSLGRTIEAWEG